MKVAILAGGLGTRITEDSHLKPKPMIEIGGFPILWHIMNIYSAQGIGDFVICAGYKQHIIKDYFNDYYIRSSDVTFDFTRQGEPLIHSNFSEPWKVTIVDTGLNTMTGGRIKRVQDYLSNDTFLLTYGDGVADVDIRKTIEFHRKHGRMATLSGVPTPQRFGVIETDERGIITAFREKDASGCGLINGGFMVIEPEVFDFINGDSTVFETETLPALADINQLASFTHYGFWQCMDTQRDRQKLENLWASGEAPWKLWD